MAKTFDKLTNVSYNINDEYSFCGQSLSLNFMNCNGKKSFLYSYDTDRFYLGFNTLDGCVIYDIESIENKTLSFSSKRFPGLKILSHDYSFNDTSLFYEDSGNKSSIKISNHVSLLTESFSESMYIDGFNPVDSFPSETDSAGHLCRMRRKTRSRRKNRKRNW